MNQLQNEKRVIMLRPQLKNDGDFANNAAMDLSGANEARVEIYTGNLDCAVGSVAETEPLKLQECDTEDGTYTDITDAELSAAIAADKDNKVFAIDVPMKKAHKKFVKVATPHAGAGSTGANLAIIGVLTKFDVGPANAEERGLEEHIIP